MDDATKVDFDTLAHLPAFDENKATYGSNVVIGNADRTTVSNNTIIPSYCAIP